MKPLYRTAFFLQRPPASLDEIAAVVEEWIFVRQGKPRQGLVRPEGWSGQAISRPLTILGEGWSVEAIFSQEPTQALWAVQVQHPDSEDDNLRWVINLTVAQQATATRFTCEVGVEWIEDRGETITRRSSQPNIVIEMLRRFGGRDAQASRQLSEKPYELKKSEVDGFVDFLLSPTRQHAVVLITRNRDGQLLVEPELWARKLGSLAYVMVAEAWDTTFALEVAVGSNRLVCWGGSIRIYRPGFTREANPYAHPLLSVESIQASLESKKPVGFIDNVVGQIAEVSAHRPYPGFAFWQDVEGMVRAGELQKLQSSAKSIPALTDAFAQDADKLKVRVKALEAEKDKLCDDYVKDVDDLEKRLKGLEAEKEKLWDEVTILREWRRIASEGMRRVRTGEPYRTALRYVPEVNTLTEAVEVAEKELAGKMVFPLNSKSDLEAPFAHPTDVLTAFRWLAGPFWESKALSKPMGLPEESLKKVLPNWSYAGNQTVTTLGRYEEWYKVDYALPGGKKAYAEQHLKFGVGADPANMIRIGFFWDDSKNLWVIGYVGPHQRNTKS
jgi:hypothetical protein